jgi:hypothetical protein
MKTNHHLDADTISDFAERKLTGDEQAAAAEHLARCPRCRDEVTWIRTLRERVRELPEEREPPTDGWPAIEQRIRSGARPPADDLDAARRRRAARRGFTADPTLRRVAAIVLLMALPAGATWLVMRSATDAPSERTAGAPAGAEERSIEEELRFAANTPEAVARAYEPTIRELRDVLEANRDRLQPGTIEVLEENLRVIDAAIEDFYRALEADPANFDTTRLLNGMYETKIQLLRQAASLAQA